MNILFSVLFIGLREGLCFHEIYRKYFYIQKSLKWSDAQQYCRQHYTDLATFTNAEEINRLKRPFTNYAWIGLFDDISSWKGIMGNESNSWRWSATGTTSPGGYQNWGTSKPDNAGGQSYCVKIEKGLWGDVACTNKYYSVCLKESSETGPTQYFPVSIALTWEDARSYCRRHYTDLATIEDEAENTAVASFYLAGPYWIGLYREAWRWSDGTNSRFTKWRTGQPNNYAKIQHCVMEYNNNEWNDWPCDDLVYFICQKVMVKRTHRMGIKLQAATDLTNPAVLTQIIAQIEEKLLNSGVSDVKVKWIAPPVKQIENESEEGTDVCLP